MKKIFLNALSFSWVFACLILMTTGCQKSIQKETISSIPDDNNIASNARHSKELKDFVQVNLVGDNDEYHPVTIDPNLVNGWGIAFAPSGPAWVNAEVKGVSLIYNKDGAILRPPVTIPSPGSPTMGGQPTGIVFNGSADFKLPNGNPARFIFVGTDGILSGWNGGNSAIKMKDNSSSAVYTGLALAADGAANFLYAANFGSRKIDVFDKDWNPVMTKPFMDHHLPWGYSPFNIQNIDGNLYVMYAKVGADGDEEKGPGKGIVDIYNAHGILLDRFVSHEQLNAPWGVAKAPAGFLDEENGEEEENNKSGKKDEDNVILVGNFGDGRINAFNDHGHFLGQLRGHGKPIKIDGLWAISFAPATATTVDPTWLFFAAGPDDEEHGLFGYLKK